MGDKIIGITQIGGLILVAILFGQMPALVYCGIMVCGHLFQQPKKNALMFDVEACILQTLRSVMNDKTRNSEWVMAEELSNKCRLAICSGAEDPQNFSVTDAIKKVLKRLLQEGIIKKEQMQVNLLNTTQENGFKKAYRSLDASYRPQKKLAFWQIGVKKRLAQNEELVKEILGCLEERPEGASLEEFVDVYGLLKSWYKTNLDCSNRLALDSQVLRVRNDLIEIGFIKKIMHGDRGVVYRVTIQCVNKTGEDDETI